MPKKADANERTAEMLKTLTIVQLGLAGVGQREIREIVGGDIKGINAIVKKLRKNKEKKSNGA